MFTHPQSHPGTSSRITTAFTLAVALLGVVTAPFCRCVCDTQSTAAAAAVDESCHHQGAGHSDDSQHSEDSCTHGECAGRIAGIPAHPGQALLGSASGPQVGSVLTPVTMWVQPIATRTTPVQIDRDVGPPIPLRTILRL